MNIIIKLFVISILTLGFISCNSDKETKNTIVEPIKPVQKLPRVNVPRINEDSVYHFVKAQVDFGPRVPGTKEHKLCKEWLISKFKSYGAEIVLQDFEADIYTGIKMASTNIIAQINPENPNRIILAAHWDSRMMAENDKNEANKDKAIDGADDGASGVGVLIEIARIIKKNPISLGIDFILFDAEDQGSRAQTQESSLTWCIGSQYWSNNNISKYKANFGILLDMVGAENATFYQEGHSRYFAPGLTHKVWTLAKKMNSGDLFNDLPGGAITDDHYYVNTIAKIPMIDIINTSRTTDNGFGSHWHTHDDNIDIISKKTLRKVTQLVTAVAYKTSDNSL